VRVVVAAGTTNTEKGGQIPKTATPWYNLLLLGLSLMLVGGLGYRGARRKVRE